MKLGGASADAYYGHVAFSTHPELDEGGRLRPRVLRRASYAEEGISLDAQREKLRQYANLLDFDLIERRADAGLIAKTLDRGKCLDLCEDSAAGAAGILPSVRLFAWVSRGVLAVTAMR